VSAFLRSMAGRVFVALALGMTGATAMAFAVAGLRVHHPVVIVVFVGCLLALAYAVARMATRPLDDLASAAARLGSDIDASPLPERGPGEVRAATAAFNAMQGRIRRDVRERTSMLAAITHDLQTPVTRLRLRLEKVADDELRAKLIDDLSVMSDTIREGLDLARSLDEREPLAHVDLDSLLESLCADAQEAGHDVTLDGRTTVSVLCAPNSLRRCVMNLMDNALAYGRFARVQSAAAGGRAVVRIRDGGPGIPEDRLQAVLDPFVRIETSRSRETGGTGLGLTIANNIAKRLGGTIALRNCPEGGLEVTLDLPASSHPTGDSQ
jgi:signal transduction histidine kinase